MDTVFHSSQDKTQQQAKTQDNYDPFYHYPICLTFKYCGYCHFYITRCNANNNNEKNWKID